VSVEVPLATRVSGRANKARDGRRLGWLGCSTVAALVVVVPRPAGAAAGGYAQENLVSDQPGVAQLTDPNMVNPWGMSRSATRSPDRAGLQRQDRVQPAGHGNAGAANVGADRVDVFDSAFRAGSSDGLFSDPTLPARLRTVECGRDRRASRARAGRARRCLHNGGWSVTALWQGDR
jgi:hypothetical protein